MDNIGSSWKTTSAGITMIAAAVVGLVFAYKNNALNEGNVTAAITAIVGGAGLIVAKDKNVTGGSVISASSDPDTVKASTTVDPKK